MMPVRRGAYVGGSQLLAYIQKLRRIDVWKASFPPHHQEKDHQQLTLSSK